MFENFVKNPCYWKIFDEQSRHLLHQKITETVQGSSSESEKLSDVDKSKDLILCKTCKHQISSAEFAVEIDEKHVHTLCNPAGIVFQIHCFSEAPGCIVRGEPRLDFTWFAGFAWNFTFCAHCLNQLGWYFQNKAGESFFGLDEAMLLQETMQ